MRWSDSSGKLQDESRAERGWRTFLDGRDNGRELLGEHRGAGGRDVRAPMQARGVRFRRMSDCSVGGATAGAQTFSAQSASGHPNASKATVIAGCMVAARLHGDAGPR